MQNINENFTAVTVCNLSTRANPQMGIKSKLIHLELNLRRNITFNIIRFLKIFLLKTMRLTFNALHYTNKITNVLNNNNNEMKHININKKRILLSSMK